MPERRRPEIIAHRGYSARAPENTLASFRAAIEVGAHALEFDVQATADGHPVVFHDFTLDRTAGRDGRLDEIDFAELRTLDAGGWFDDRFAGERVPSLAEALELASAHRAPAGPLTRLYPELKGWREPRDVERMIHGIRAAGWEDDVVVISLDWDGLGLVRELSETVTIGFVYDDARLHAEALDLAAADGNAIVDPDFRLLLDDAIDRAAQARERGLDVACWTVDEVDDARRLVRRGVTRLTTNEVETMLTAFEEETR